MEEESKTYGSKRFLAKPESYCLERDMSKSIYTQAEVKTSGCK